MISKLLQKAMDRAALMMTETISEDLFRDMDPLNTEWWIAVHDASKHYRKRRRGFFKLWMDELQENRFKGGFGGMMAVINGSTTYSGGDKIIAPFEFHPISRTYP